MFHTRQAKEITRLLITLGSGILAALFLLAYFLVYYNPEGVYLAKNTLLSPSMLSKLSYVEEHGNAKTMPRFVFSKIIVRLFDEKTKTYLEKPLPLETYAIFYQQLSNDKNSAEEMLKPPFSEIEIQVKEEKGQNQKIFQRIQFSSDGNTYRVELKDASLQEKWVYYTHPGILRTVWQLSSF